MHTVVLVHGGSHGAWCWYKLTPKLEQAGLRVITPDSAGLGDDETPASEVTLERWADDICRILDEQDQPVILVGHSRGGIIISTAAEKRPAKVAKLVYVSAMMIGSGETAFGVVHEDGTSLMLPNAEMASDGASMSIRAEALKDVFYGYASDEDLALAKGRLRPDPVAPLMTPLVLTDEAFGSVPRAYVECLQDNAVPIGLQRRMQEVFPCGEVVSIATDHTPFFSEPDRLAQCLIDIARVDSGPIGRSD